MTTKHIIIKHLGFNIFQTYRLVFVLLMLMSLCAYVPHGIFADNFIAPSIVLQNETSEEDLMTRYGQVLFSQDGNTLIATNAKCIDFWDIKTSKIIRTIKSEDFSFRTFFSSSFSSDLSTFIITNSSSQMQDGILYAKLVDTKTSQVIWETKSNPDEVFTNPNSYPGQIIVRYGYAYLSPNGTRAMMHFKWDGEERGVFLTNALTGEFIQTFDFSATETWKFLPDDKLLTYKDLGTGENCVRIYDLASGDLVRESIEPAFEQIASAGNHIYAWFPQENAFRAYDILNGIKNDQYYRKDQNTIFCFDIYKDGRKILYDDNTASLHIAELIPNKEADSGEIVKRLTLVDTDPGIIGSRNLFFDNNFGKYAGIITNEDAEIWLWDLEELGLSGVKQGEEYQ